MEYKLTKRQLERLESMRESVAKGRIEILDNAFVSSSQSIQRMHEQHDKDVKLFLVDILEGHGVTMDDDELKKWKFDGSALTKEDKKEGKK